MSTERAERRSGGWSVQVLLATLLVGNAALVVLLLPRSDLLPHVAQVAELVAYSMLVVGAGLLYVHHRLTPGHATAWLTTAAVFGSLQAVGYSVIRIAMDHQVAHHGLGLGAMEVLVALVLVVMLAAGPRSRDPVAPLLLGVSMALLVTTARVTMLAPPHPPTPVDVEMKTPLLVATALVLYGVIAVLVLRRATLPAWATRNLAPAAVALAVAHVLTYPVAPNDWRSAVGAGLDVAGGLLVALTALRLVRGALEQRAETDRQVDELEARVREDQVLLHEVASTVAGIVAASHLVASAPQLATADRQRLQGLLDSERARLDRLLSRSGNELVTEVDLDEVLAPIVLSHRIRGRAVDWNAAGTRVRGRPGALTEVVDILLDNSAVHSGSASVHVDVVTHRDVVRLRVSDDGCGIPPELSTSVLDWGTRGASSNGHGIGLCVAGRLVSEMGGRLDVHSDGTTGTTVAVTLPRVDTAEAPRASTILDRRIG